MTRAVILIPDHRRAASWLAARSLRSLSSAAGLRSLSVETAQESDWPALALHQAAGPLKAAVSPARVASRKEAARDEGLLVISAGAWFPHPDLPELPPPSATGRPVLAFGLSPAVEADTGHGWRTLSRAKGGDLSGMAAKLSCAGRPPVLALDGKALHFLRAGRSWEELLAEGRVVHLSTLDVMEDPGLRTVQIITSLQYGGAERLALGLHQELRKTGAATRLLVLGKPGRSAFPHPPECEDLSDSPANPVSRAAAVARAAGAFGADLLHAHLLNAAEIKALRPHGIPLLLNLHNTSSGWPADFSALEPGDAALLAACSLGVEAEVRRLLPRLPIRCAWNGIDPAHFQRSPRRSAEAAHFRKSVGLEPGDFLILTLANPRPQKRLDRLPSVIAALRRLRPDKTIRLLIAGEAAAFNEEAAGCVKAVKQAAGDHGVADEVIFTGPVSDTPALLAAADVLLSTAAHEGLSLAHLEALAMELPVVALEAGGTGEIARAAGPAFAQLPQSSTPDEIARAMLTMLPPKNLTDSSRQAGREAVRSCFSLEAMTRRYLRLYQIALMAPREPGRTIWLITNNFATGGAQSSARRLLSHWFQQGLRVRAAVLQEEPEDLTPGRAALEKTGIPVLVLPRIGPHEAAETLAPLWPELEADPPRALLFWNAITSCKRLIADALPGSPVFDISPGGMFFESLHPSFARPRPDIPALGPETYGACLAGAVVKYAREKSQAEAALGTEAHVIPNGVELPENPVPFRENPAILRFGSAARLHPQKRLEDLIEAFRLALPRLPAAELHIAGGVDGEEEEYAASLRQSAPDLPVIWRGNLSPLTSFHAELDIFVMISEPAGCPNASLEALAAGLPVIATDCGGASEQVLSGDTGLLVPHRDTAALAEAMIRLAGDSALRRHCAEHARRHIRSHFTVPLMAERYLRMIDARAEGGAGRK